VQTGSGAHPAWVPGTLTLGVKRPGSEADHSPPSSAEVKNAWSYTTIPPVRLHGRLFFDKLSNNFSKNILHHRAGWLVNVVSFALLRLNVQRNMIYQLTLISIFFCNRRRFIVTYLDNVIM
jgi:hypothetical protein